MKKTTYLNQILMVVALIACLANAHAQCTPPPAPTGSTLQVFCSGVTVANLVVTGQNILWYNVATGGTPISISTVLVNGGHYYASQTVSGCQSTTRLNVKADINLTPSVNQQSNKTICAGAVQAVIVWSSIGIPGTVFSWTNDNPTIGLAASGTGYLSSFKAVNTNSFPVSVDIAVTPSSSNGCTGAAMIFTITVNPAPTITIDGPSFVCSGGTLMLTAGNASAYLWSTGATTQNITISAAATYSVTGDDGCSTSAKIPLNTVPYAPTSIIAPTGGSRVCPGDQYTYSIKKVVNTTGYTWVAPASGTVTGGGGPSDTFITILYNTLITGTNIISVTSNNFCGSSAARTLTIYGNIAPKPGLISSSPLGGNRVCPGDVYTYTIRKINLVNDPIQYNWIPPVTSSVIGGGSSTDTSITLQFVSKISLRDTLFVRTTNVCNTSAFTFLILTAANLTMPGAIAGPNSVCANSTNTYSISPVASATSYIWTVPAGVSIQGASNGTSINVLFASSGGSITVKAANNCGTSSARSLAVAITCREAELQNNSDGNAFNFELFPNPTRGKTTIRFNDAGLSNYSLRILNMLGQEVINKEGKSQEGINIIEFDMNGFTSGIYVLSFSVGDQSKAIRIIVE